MVLSIAELRCDALLHARNRPPHAVDDELAAVAGLPVGQSRLLGADATPEAVRAALRTHAYAHLACHGSYDPEDPSAGGLLLHGGEPTVHDLATQRLNEAEFACLSAWHTAAPGPAPADEVITLASALQLCGYRHVIGSLWAVDGRFGARAAPGGPTAAR